MKEESRVFYNPDGYIEVVIVGRPSSMTFYGLKADAEELLNSAEIKSALENKPVLGLIDASRQEGLSPEANKAALESLEAIQSERLALFGLDMLLREIVKGLVLAMGRSGSFKIFQTREEAVA